MTTPNDIMYAALRVIGVGQSGEAFDADDIAIAFNGLKSLLQEWAPGIIIPSITQEAITLVASQSSYTIGENGSPDLNTRRPEKINDAFVRDSSGYDHSVTIIGETQYNKRYSKTLSGRPDELWYNPTSPNGTVYVFPVPEDAESLYISSQKQLSLPSAENENLLNTTQIPPIYFNPLKWNLAVEISAEFGAPVTPLMAMRASNGYDNLLSINLSKSVEPADLEISNNYKSDRNILSF